VSDKQDLTDKLDTYIDLREKLDNLGSDLDDITSLVSRIAMSEPSACDLRLQARAISDALTDLLESVDERSNELENLLDDLD
jgi:DNA mismatch repair ATPase MutS